MNELHLLLYCPFLNNLISSLELGFLCTILKSKWIENSKIILNISLFVEHLVLNEDKVFQLFMPMNHRHEIVSFGLLQMFTSSESDEWYCIYNCYYVL